MGMCSAPGNPKITRGGGGPKSQNGMIQFAETRGQQAVGSFPLPLLVPFGPTPSRFSKSIQSIHPLSLMLRELLKPTRWWELPRWANSPVRPTGAGQIGAELGSQVA